MIERINRAAEKALAGGLTQDEALELIEIEAPGEIHLLMAQANRVRERIKGDEVELCAIINAKSGLCSENCVFCAQSAHNPADIQTYPLLEPEKIAEAARAARAVGVHRFSVVTSGRGAPRGREMEIVAEAIGRIAETGLSPCASLGLLDDESAETLKHAGLRRYHHNLETAPSHFDRICTTHSLDDRVRTVRLAREKGFEVCCGGIIGLGETRAQRVELAFTLKELAPESVPMNFLNPIPGTPLEGEPALPPLEILKTIAVFRLVMPETDIRTCGGREKNLRGLQPMMFVAGATATMTGNYLTTQGRSTEDDVRDILDLGLRLKA